MHHQQQEVKQERKQDCNLKQAQIYEDISRALEGCLSALAPLRGGRLLVTGGTGFAGTWLAETVAYLNDAHDFGLHLLLVARNTDKFAEDRPHLASRSEIALLRQDVRNLRDLPPDVTWIVHAGATPDNRTHNSEPVRTCDTIVGGTKSVLEAAVRLPRLDGLLNLSSGLVYGPQPPDLLHVPEDGFHGFDPSAFGSVYAESKRLAETLCFVYANQQRLRVINARMFAFVGPYQSLDRSWAINSFLRDGLHGGPIRILGDGETVRSYLYAADMAAWLLTILASGTSGESYNVGSPEETTLAAAAALVASLIPAAPKIVQPLSPGHVSPGHASASAARPAGHARFVPDVSRSHRELGVLPTLDLTAALKRTLAWNAS